MKVLQVTNIVSHHQLPFAKEVCKIVGKENFLFAAMSEVSEERLNNGWKSQFSESWIIHPNLDSESMRRFNDFWSEADIVLCGERLITKIQSRLDDKKICIYMSERWWKPPVGMLRLCSPAYLKMFFSFLRLTKSEYFHYFPIGPFADSDMRLVTSMNNRVWRWGYFTEKPKILPERSYDVINILWIGRMLSWKRVDLLIEALGRLKNDGIEFRLTLVGDGKERGKLQKLAVNLLGNDYFQLLDFIPSTQVPQLMSQNDIYVLPSSGFEGWGAVINEAMWMGCAVVASNKTGAGASMINHGVNGYLFKSGSVSSLYEHLKKLISDRAHLKEVGDNAKLSIERSWSPSVAAERFVYLSNSLLDKKIAAPAYDGLLSSCNRQ